MSVSEGQFGITFCFGNEICIGSTWEGARGIVMCLQNFRNETGNAFIRGAVFIRGACGALKGHAEASGKATPDPRVHWELHRITETILVGALGIVCGAGNFNCLQFV